MEDEMDFDQLLADAEQEQGMYDDYVDDMEAELAMEAEASTTTPTNGASIVPNIPRPLGISEPSSDVGESRAQASHGGGDLGGMETLLPVSSARNPSPLSLERRLGLAGLFGDDEEEDDEGEEDALRPVARALNREGLSPLNPVLMDDRKSNRWTGRRSASGQPASSRASVRRPRPEETAAPRIYIPSSRKPFGVKVDTRGKVLARPPMDCDSIPFMQAGGQMMHLRLRTSPESSLGASDSLENNASVSSHPTAGNLLRVPMAELMSRVDERRVIERSLATAAIEAAANGHTVDPLEGQDDTKGQIGVGRAEEGGGGTGSGGVGTRGALWVDKYAPDGFRDLLSDEKINREVLRAVKAWDPFVFRKERAKGGASSGKASTGLGGKIAGAARFGSDDSSDARPGARVIMLCGPPGLGKTTLAQVVARHAGYRVYEINASDDRTAAVLRRRMTEAMEGTTLLADKRPNLIVLDEVDGADGKAAAQVIVDMATAPLAKSASSGGKKSKRKALTRPLMLICNDQWTPALRPIRALAQVFVFRPRASPARLVQRLKTICSAEKLCVNTDALTRLADRSHLDVRSCLNTLQFVARRAASGGVRNASAALLTALADGVKDEKRDLFQVLRSVFTRKKAGTKRRLFVGGEQGQAGTYVTDKRDTDVLEEVECFNDHQKVLGGLHESFLGIRFNDPTLYKASAALDWLDFADLMDARTNRTQDHSFTRYAPLAAAGMHYLCRSDQRATVSQPKKEFEVRTARAAKANILQSFSDGRELGSTGGSTEAIVLDMLSHFMDILAPNLRPLNPDLQSPQERERFRNLVGILISCGLTFAPTSAGNSGGEQSYGGFPGKPVQEFVLEPAIDQLLRYDGYDFAHPILSSPLRPIVAHEVALESMRRAEASKTQEQEQASTEPESSSTKTPPLAITSGSLDKPLSTIPANQPRLPFTSSSKNNPANSEKDKMEASSEISTEMSGKSGLSAATEVVGKTTKTIGSGGHESGPTSIEKSDTADDTSVRAEREDGRPAHVVPFWNRTNWIAGRKDGTGAKGSAADKRGEGGGPPPAAAGGMGKGGKVGGDSEKPGTELKRPREEDADGEQGKQDERVLRYQFRAGYTNAVRRPVRMKDLM